MPIDPTTSSPAFAPAPRPGTPPPPDPSTSATTPPMQPDSVRKSAAVDQTKFYTAESIHAAINGAPHAATAAASAIAAGARGAIGRAGPTLEELGSKAVGVAGEMAAGPAAFMGFFAATTAPAGETPDQLAHARAIDAQGRHDSTTRTPAIATCGIEHTGHAAAPAATIGRTSTPIEHVANSTTTSPAHSVDRATAVSGKPVGSAGSASDLILEASRFKLTPSSGPPTQGTVDTNSPSSVRNAARIEGLRGEMTSDTSSRATVAVAVAKDAHGNEIHLISTNKGKYLQPDMKRQVDELPVGKRGVDAEQNIVNYAHDKGLTLTDIAASRPVCSNCEKSIETTGAHISSPLKGSPARGNL